MNKPGASALELYVIEEVKARRKELGLTAMELSHLMNKASSFVSNVENHKRIDRYNLKNLNDLALIFGCSPRDFLPENPFKKDLKTV